MNNTNANAASIKLLAEIKTEHPGMFANEPGMLTMEQARHYTAARTGKLHAQPNMFNYLKDAGIVAARKSPGLPSYYRLADIEQFCIRLLEVMK